MKVWACLFLSLFLLSGASLALAGQPDAAAVSVDVADAAQEQAPSSVAVPRLESPVTDLTGTLGNDWIATMTQRLMALQQRKGSQLAVLMVPSTGEDSIEQYATRVFEQWRLGRQGVDDGVLVLVAKDDRTMRIEVGYGLEGAIPDVIAGRIIREEMVPAFRNGDFADGIEKAVGVLERLIDGETLPEESRDFRLTAEGWALLVGLGVGALAGAALRRRWLGVKIVIPGAAGVAMVLALGCGLQSAPAMLFALSFCLLMGGGVGALAASSGKAAMIVGGIVLYLTAIALGAAQFGSDVPLFGLALPFAAGIGLVFLCLPFFLAFGAWKRSRVEFFVRLALATGIAGFVIHTAGILQRPWEFPDSLALIPMLYFPFLVAFMSGGGSGSGSGASGGGSSSSGGSSYSGGGGSSGGGGASGRW